VNDGRRHTGRVVPAPATWAGDLLFAGGWNIGLLWVLATLFKR
jgi:hypothetical protein